MKIDMTKAFDKVSWDLVLGILTRLGFTLEFVDLISECISSMDFSIIQDGRPISIVSPK